MVFIMPVMVTGGALRMAMPGIGTADRVELRLDLLDPGTKPLKHRLDDMIAQDQDSVSLDSRSEVAVADVPGEFREVQGTMAADGVKGLAGGRDLDDAVSFQQQRIARLQDDRLGKINQDLAAIDQFDRPAAQVALIVLEHRSAEHRIMMRIRLRCSPYSYRLQHWFWP
ncbi:hypothetical protein MVG78_06990 [Roseomonas gilardii subsp. gilardii]|nr:hypothetical protein [Roseomonas gilardii]UPG73870.1 hypothetical protein MVG78_06990 [Roseomonas gilardii subsp. gilardii]